MTRCPWVNLKNPIYVEYHDSEWCVPKHDDALLFELLILEMFQAGLSWECVLNKRNAFRQAFDNFDVVKVAEYDENKIAGLVSNPDIIRNKLKIRAAVNNSKIFLKIQSEFGSFNEYIWCFTNNRIIVQDCTKYTKSELSDKISDDLRKRGMKFVGSTIIYSYLQAIGIINGHCKDCYRFGL